MLVGCLVAAQVHGSPQEQVSAVAAEDPSETVVFLVRHAEKQIGEDPELTARGQARASKLADLLMHAGINYLHSSDYSRTKQTAAPLAVAFGLVTQLYDPRDLPALVKRIRDKGGRHVIVGHSNTVPQTVALLGGEPGAAIAENEYDRLYLVTLANGMAVTTVQLRY